MIAVDILHAFATGNFADVAIRLVGVAVAITVHEYAHAKRADLAGDSTPRQNGRLSLNPIDHFDPIGTTAFLLFGIGWAKPVPVNPRSFRNPRRDAIMVSLWGPLANVLLAVALGLVIKFIPIANLMLLRLLLFTAVLNLVLAVFNLFPIPPLDGSHILSGLLPYPQARSYELFAARYGLMLLLVVIFVGSRFIAPVVDLFLRLLQL